MTQRMRALLRDGPGKVRCAEIDRPTPGPGEVLLRVQACGECGSDKSRFNGKDTREATRGNAWNTTSPIGHEFLGNVVEVGEGVSNSFSADQLFSAAPLRPCHECHMCRKGLHANCPKSTFIGSSANGAFAEFVAVPAINLVPLAAGLDLVEGASLEPLAVVLHALECGGYLDDDIPETAAVVGLGYIGLLAVAVLKYLDFPNIVAVYSRLEQAKMAQRLGATHIVSGRDENVEEALKSVGGANLVFEAAGSQTASEQAIFALAPAGTILWVGTPAGPDGLVRSKACLQRLMRYRATEKWTFMSHGAPWPGRAWTLGAELLAEGAVNPALVVDAQCSFEEAPAILEADLAGTAKRVKIIVNF